MKGEVEGMVNELASSMCKPLVSFLKEVKRDNDASMVVSKLQRLVAETDCRVSSEFQTLTTANDEYKAHVRKMDFQLQVCNREVEKMSQDGEKLRISLKEKVEEVEALRMVLAVEAAEKQNYKAQLDNEVVKACRLEEELRQKESKLAHAIKLLEATKLQISHQHSQITDACTKSRELCSQLAAMDDKLKQTDVAVMDSYLNGDADGAENHEQRMCVQQPSKEQQINPQYSLLKEGKQEFMDNFLKWLSAGMAERQSNCPDKAQLHEAVVLFTKHYCRQEKSRALIEAMKDAVVLFTKHLENTVNSGAMKEESLLSTDILLEELEKNFVYWLSDFEHSQSLVQHSQQTQDSREECRISTGSTNTETMALTLDTCLPLFYLLAHAVDTVEGLARTQSCTSIAVCSDICSKYLRNLLCLLHVDVSVPSKTSGNFLQLVAAVAMATMSKPECAGSQLKSCCNGFGALSQQQQEQQRSNVVQHIEREEVAQHDEQKVKQLTSDVSSGSSSCEQGLGGSKRSIHSSLHVEQEMDKGVVPFSAKRIHTHTDAVKREPQLQMQSCPPPGSVLSHKMIEGIKDQSTLVVIEGQKDCQSILLPKEGGSQSTVLLLEDEKGRPNRSSKELWQVLELGSCNKTMKCFYNGEATALEPNRHSSEPLLDLRDDVQRPPRPFGKRASPRLLARRLAHSPYPRCK